MNTKHRTKPSKYIDIIQVFLLILLFFLILMPDHSKSSNFLDRDRQEIRSENIQQLFR